jgi:hypothetical protein
MKLKPVAASFAVCASVLISGQVAAKIDYDTYCRLPTVQAKQQAMSGVSNENGFEVETTKTSGFASSLSTVSDLSTAKPEV